MKRIAIQGIAGSFHEDAARKYFTMKKLKLLNVNHLQVFVN